MTVVRAVLQEVLEVEMTEALGAGKGELRRGGLATVGHHELHPVKPTLLEPIEELPPARAALAVGQPYAHHLAMFSSTHATSRA